MVAPVNFKKLPLVNQTAITAYDIAKTVDFWSRFGIKYLSVLETNQEKSNNLTKLVSVVVPKEIKKWKIGLENDKGILASLLVLQYWALAILLHTPKATINNKPEYAYTVLKSRIKHAGLDLVSHFE
ncbi:unnamed protein product [Sphenostylis stenocarpa]|uniref:Uncharacterized protein n=1 Tax=Sphenostylis stenocarpa TaxID=92480 RepID=A0AA86SVS4_9FABA|nr:unnamed protein product [Sphenostylis stenocarpa]